MMPKGYDQKPRTDHIMANRKRTKRQTIIYKIQHRKLKIEKREPTLKKPCEGYENELI
jgi:hypothetical protein